jgi:hypothetical protein
VQIIRKNQTRREGNRRKIWVSRKALDTVRLRQAVSWQPRKNRFDAEFT